MSLAGPEDLVLQQLSRLPALSPDAARAGALRMQCHDALRRRQECSQRAAPPPHRMKPLKAAVIGGLCAAYVWSLLATLIAIRLALH